MNRKPLLKENLIHYRTMYLLTALIVGSLEVLLLTRSLIFTSENLFRLEIETIFLALLIVLYFAILLIFEVIIMTLERSYATGRVIFSVGYSLIHYCAFKKKWIDIFTRSDYAIIPALLLKLLIFLVIVQVIWSLLISIKQFKSK